MRIASGLYKGKEILYPPTGGVRPTSDKVRQALMNSLRDELRGARFLDLYAGTGAVGIEALSQGAGFACFVESAGRVYTVLKKNLETIVADPSKYMTVRHNAAQLNREVLDTEPFHIIFADPFYRDAVFDFDPLHDAAFEYLAPGGIFIFEHSSKDDFASFRGFFCRREYGDTALSEFRKDKA